MYQGRIYDVGAPAEVITENNLRVVYGVTSKVIDDNGRPHVILEDAVPMGEEEPASPVMAAAKRAKAEETTKAGEKGEA